MGFDSVDQRQRRVVRMQTRNHRYAKSASAHSRSNELSRLLQVLGS